MARNARGKGRAKQSPLISTRLNRDDNDRFEQLCVTSGKSRTQVARDALLAHIDQTTKVDEGQVKDALAERLKKTEDRLASLLARISLDVGIVNQVLWIRTDPDVREKLWSAASKYASQRLHTKLTGRDLEVKETIKADINAEDKIA